MNVLLNNTLTRYSNNIVNQNSASILNYLLGAVESVADRRNGYGLYTCGVGIHTGMVVHVSTNSRLAAALAAGVSIALRVVVINPLADRIQDEMIGPNPLLLIPIPGEFFGSRRFPISVSPRLLSAALGIEDDNVTRLQTRLVRIITSLALLGTIDYCALRFIVSRVNNYFQVNN